MPSLLCGLTWLAAAQLAAAQSTTSVSVYMMINPQAVLPDTISFLYDGATSTGFVAAANPEATTYIFSRPPVSESFYGDYGVFSDHTLVNGPSTWAEWRGGSDPEKPLYAHACSLTGSPLVYDCTLTNYGPFVTEGAPTSTSFWSTTTTTISPEARTFVDITGLITEGVELLDGTATAMPTAYAAATGTYDEDLASASSSASSSAAGSETAENRAQGMSYGTPFLLVAGLVGGAAVVL